MLVGLTAVVDNDIKHQLKEAAAVYQVKFVRVNFTRPEDIINALAQQDGSDILVVTRGGGENIHLFENPSIANQAISLKSALVTAIGHATDEPLLQKIADRSFITPTALGQYLYDVYIRVTEELANSKGKLIEDVTKQMELQFNGRLKDLNLLVQETKKTLEEERSRNETQQKLYSEQLTRSKKANAQLALIIIIFLILLLVVIFR